MPPKKTTAGPSKRKRSTKEVDPSAFDPTFVNPQAREAFQSSIGRRQCIPERGFRDPMAGVWSIINERQWELFTSAPQAAVVPIVREFYANAKEQLSADTRHFTALVRGKQVPYDSHSINRFYNLEDIGEDDYTAWSEQGVDDDMVIRSIARRGAQWKRVNDKALNFPISSLKGESRAWHLFISAKFLPSKHYTEVTRERAALNYAIQNGLSIDVGRLIQRSIIGCIHGRGGLGHPSLIYALCLKAGVPESPSEEVQHPLPAITGSKIFAWETEDLDAVAPPPQPDPARTRPTMASMQQQLHTVSSKVDRLTRNQEQMMQTQRQMMAEQRQQFSYLSEYTIALNSMFHNCSLSQGASSVTFPTPPIFPPFPEPEVPKESGNEESEESEDEEEDEDDEQ